MVLEMPVVLFVIATLIAIVVILLFILLGQTQKTKRTANGPQTSMEQLKKYFLIDPHTGAYNQSFLAKKLEEETYRSARYNSHFTTVVFRFASVFSQLDKEKADSIYRMLAVAASRDTRYSDFVATLENYGLAVIFTMTSKPSSEVPLNRLLLRFEDILKKEGIEGKPEVRVYGFPEDKTEIEKLIAELKE
jgi:GGDEF domain-containing protein